MKLMMIIMWMNETKRRMGTKQMKTKRIGTRTGAWRKRMRSSRERVVRVTSGHAVPRNDIKKRMRKKIMMQAGAEGETLRPMDARSVQSVPMLGL
jgi:hypothetical protein